MIKQSTIIKIILLALICIVPIYLYTQKHQQQDNQEQPLYWVAPMDANYKRDKPGKSPMGMDLVPVYANSTKDNTITVSPNVQQNLGLKTTIIQFKSFKKKIHSYGIVESDEKLISHLHTYTEGWIKKLYVKTTGETVQKGQLLFEFYSLELMNAQQEFLMAVRQNARTLIESSENKLLALGVTPKQIKEIRKNKKLTQRIKFHAPQNGFVSELKVREGMYVHPSNNVMTIIDLTQVWIIAEFFEQDINWIKEGQFVQAKLDYKPKLSWSGKIDYIYPKLDPKNRTVRARLVFNNQEQILKPGMYANIDVTVESKSEVLTIPKQALIQTEKENRVLTKSGNKFQVHKVQVGLSNEHEYEILKGLSEGMQVVISGQFLIDSEADIKASLERFSNNKNTPKAHEHHQHMH